MRTLVTSIAILLAAAPASADWQVSPSRQELAMMPGESRTFVVRVSRDGIPETAASPVRFTVTTGDWDIGERGEVVFAASRSTADSAAAWTGFNPSDFELLTGGSIQVRVSVTVPADAPPGLYRAALFYEEHSPVPPQRESTRRMVVRYRLSTLLYVSVDRLEPGFELRTVELSRDASSLSARFANVGTSHLRPRHWIELIDTDGATILRTEPVPTMVLLPGRRLEIEAPLPGVPAGRTVGTVRYFVDAGTDLPLQVVTLPLAVPAVTAGPPAGTAG